MSINGGEQARVNKLKVNEHGNIKAALILFSLIIINIIQRDD